MYKILFPIIAALLIGSLSTSCDPYRKMAKSNNISEKDSAAMHYYQKKKYDQAAYLLEELLGVYRPTSRGEEIYYYYAYCRFYMGELVSAAYYFEDFVKQYPQSKHVEEFRYKHAYCYYLLSDPWYLDQKYTYLAIDEIQLFLSRYPYSEHKPECNKMLTELREKLARKSFEQASLYYKISYYKAAVEAFQNMMDKFPDSRFREEAQYLLVASANKLAGVSISSKKKERYQEAISFAEKFEQKYQDSKFGSEVEDIKQSASKNVERISKEEKAEKEEKFFNLFEQNMKAAMDSPSADERESSYQKAMDNYEKIRDLNPESKFLSDAEKWFRKFDAKFKPQP